MRVRVFWSMVLFDFGMFWNEVLFSRGGLFGDCLRWGRFDVSFGDVALVLAFAVLLSIPVAIRRV
jgi:hypothetical protein